MQTTAELAPLAEDIEQVGKGLEVLGEVVGGLQVGDPLARARILEGISELFTRLNRVRAGLQVAQGAGGPREARGVRRPVQAARPEHRERLSVADSPEKCDEGMSRQQYVRSQARGRQRCFQAINQVALSQYLEKPWDNSQLLLVVQSAPNARALPRSPRKSRSVDSANSSLKDVQTRLIKAFL